MSPSSERWPWPLAEPDVNPSNRLLVAIRTLRDDVLDYWDLATATADRAARIHRSHVEWWKRIWRLDEE